MKCDLSNTKLEELKKVIENINDKTSKEVIHIELSKEEPSLFDSKFGGIPYLSKNEDIPVNNQGKQLKLLAQINFNDIKNANIFPKEGILQFYIYSDELYGADFDNLTLQNNFRVIYHENVDFAINKSDIEKKIYNYKIAEEEEDFPIEGEFKLDFILSKEGITASDYRFEKIFIEEYNKYFPDNTTDALYDLEDDIYDELLDEHNSGGHKIGGYPFFTQEDPRDYKNLNEFDTVLLQIDSEFDEIDTDIMWGDSGVCNFLINSQDLKNKDFSKIIYNWDCC